jgi:hypothetical protein
LRHSAVFSEKRREDEDEEGVEEREEEEKEEKEEMRVVSVCTGSLLCRRVCTRKYRSFCSFSSC